MAGCGSCNGGHWTLFLKKLGRCPQCVQISALGALTAWAATVVTLHVVPFASVQAVTLFAAGALSLLFFVHAVAFTRRASAFERAAVFNAEQETGEPFVDDSRFLLAGSIDLASLLAAPIMSAVGSGPAVSMAAKAGRSVRRAVVRPSRLFTDDKRPGDDCVKDWKQKGKKFVLFCKGTCPPLFDKNGKKYKGDCKLIKKSNEKKPIAYECVCIYPVDTDCKIEKKDQGKPTEHLECVNDCPDLYLTDPTKDTKAKPVDAECTMVANDAPGDEEELTCICVYY
jgi:predicted lipoprotein with Yx(FWY)xxD motif